MELPSTTRSGPGALIHPLLGAQRTSKAEEKTPLTFNLGPSKETPFSPASQPGWSSRDQPGSLGLRSTWIRLRRRGSSVLGGAVESRLSHSFRGLGVSYGRGVGGAGVWTDREPPTATASDPGRGGGESRASAEAARGGEERVSARPFITRPAPTPAAWVQPVPITRSLRSLL